MSHLVTAVIAFKAATLLLGGLVTFFSWKAWKRTGAGPMRSFTIGFGIVTVGAFLAGVVHQLTALDILYSILLQSVLTATGFAVIVYSMYAE